MMQNKKMINGMTEKEYKAAYRLSTWNKIMRRIDEHFPVGKTVMLMTTDPMHDNRPLFKSGRIRGKKL